MKKAEPLLSGAHWQDERQWAQTETQEIPSEIRKHFFTVREVKHWHRLPGEIVESPSLEIFKSHRDMVLGGLF